LSKRQKPAQKTGSVFPSAKITPETQLKLGEGAWIGDFVFVHLEQLTLGKGSQVAAFASLTGGGEVHVGEYTTIGYGVRVIAGTDSTEGRYMADKAPVVERNVIRGTVKIGSGCFIGANSVICVSKRHPNLEIGDHAVIGALSYVDHSVPANSVGWGAPFRPVRERGIPR
jgi:acetyltransferase-like isoleucine patch superfamily enzyme